MALTLIRFICLTCSLIAIYVLWIFGATNTYGPIYAYDIAPKGVLPGFPDVPYKTSYTGFPSVDTKIVPYVMTYFGIYDRSAPSLYLFFIALWGSTGAARILILMEDCRRHSFPKSFKKNAIMMTVAAVFGGGAIFPAYFAMTLASEPNYDNGEILASNAIFLENVPIYMALSYCVGGIMMLLPAPSLISHDLQQTAISLFPLGPLMLASCVCFTRIRNRGKANHRSPEAIRATMKSLYIIALGFSAVTHLAAVLPGAAGTLGYNPIYPKGSDITLSNIFIPPSPSTINGVLSSAIKIDFGLDYLTMVPPALLWAAYLQVQGGRTVKQRIGFARPIVKALALCTVVGPFGAAAVLLWERDEVIHQHKREIKQK